MCLLRDTQFYKVLISRHKLTPRRKWNSWDLGFKISPRLSDYSVNNPSYLRSHQTRLDRNGTEQVIRTGTPDRRWRRAYLGASTTVSASSGTVNRRQNAASCAGSWVLTTQGGVCSRETWASSCRTLCFCSPGVWSFWRHWSWSDLGVWTQGSSRGTPSSYRDSWV